MVSLRVALCVALAAVVAGHSGPPPSHSRHFQYGDDPPPHSAPGHHWYRYSYGGTVATPPSAGPSGYAKGFGYTGLHGKPYIKIYNYDPRRRQHSRGYRYSDHSRGYAQDYDYGQPRDNFKYVREYYNDRFHHLREHERERYYPGPSYHGGRRRPYGARGRGSTVFVLGSKKAYDDFPRRRYPSGPGGYPGGYPDHYPGGYRGGSNYHDDERDVYLGKGHYGGGKNYYRDDKSYYGGGKPYYGGGGGFQSILRGSSGFPHGKGTRYYGGGGGFDNYVPQSEHRHGYKDIDVIGGIGENLFGRRRYGKKDYHSGRSYHSGISYHGGDDSRHSGGYHSGGGSYHGDDDDFYHSGGGSYRGPYDDNGFVSLSSISRPV